MVGAAAGVAAVAIVGGATFAYNKREEVGQFLGRVGTVPAVLLFGAASIPLAVAFLMWRSWLPEKKHYFKLLLIFRSHSCLMQESDHIKLTLKEIRCKFVC